MLSKLVTLFESGNTTDPPRASYLLSMVFKIYRPKVSHAAHLISMVFKDSRPKSEVSLVFWTGVFLSPGRKKICVTGKETGPGPGGYG